MKKSAFIGVLLWMVGQFTFAQTLTLDQLKALKNEFQPDIVQEKDADITYPVTGMVNINVKNSLMGEVIVEVEVWVVDSKGKLVYNNIFAAKDLSEKNFDREYMRYMSLQGKRLLKRRHVLVNSNQRNTRDS